MRSLFREVGRLAARSPIPWNDSGVRSIRTALLGGSSGDAEAQLAAMASSGILFTIVNGIASDVSRVEWHLHRTRGIRAGSVCQLCEAPSATLVPDHQALRVWNQPNNFMTGMEFRETIQQHVDLTGEGWWVAEKAALGGFPVGMWPIRPDKMEPIPSRENFLDGYIYRGPRGEDVPLDLDEVVQIRMPNPLDPYRGLGPVQAAMVELDSTKYTMEWNRQFFANSAQPGGLIEVPENKSLSDVQWRRLRQQWGEQHQGIRNAHRVGILENGMKWVDRAFSHEQMQFADLYELGKQGIREAFRYPTHMLGTVEDVNRATAESADAFYARRLLVPRLDRIKAAVNADFLPMFGDNTTGLQFVYDNPVPADREADNAERDSKTAAYKTLIDAGVDPEDAAATVGLPPMRHAAGAGPELLLEEMAA